jgi:DNA helicase-2/ATP-dependent DNA helicase PcrA
MTKQKTKDMLCGLTTAQSQAVQSPARRVLVVAGAGSGKTEVMARRIAWWVGVEGVKREQIVAFTFTERAAEEMKFRIRGWMQKITPAGEEVSLGGMYIGTIHGYCLQKIREFWPDEYHNYDILDEGARASLIHRGFHGIIGLKSLQDALGKGMFATIASFMNGYDQLHEHNAFNVELPVGARPQKLGAAERDWCAQARLLTDVGSDDPAQAFAVSAARYYAYLRCRRFLDFSTSQSEFIRCLEQDESIRKQLADARIHLVVDEVQDINPVQRKLIQLLTGEHGKLTMVGDHRQSIYGFRGAKVDIIAEFWEALKTSADGEVVDLQENFRSTPRIIRVANDWARSISQLRGMTTPDMLHGKVDRVDQHCSHIAMVGFDERMEEAAWIADAIRILVPHETDGAQHDKKDGATRGIALSDLAILVRSTTDVRAYMRGLEAAGIPSVVRAGPDLFSQPEVLLFVAALGMSADATEFIGSPHNPKSLPNRIAAVLGCQSTAESVLSAAAEQIRNAGLALPTEVEERLTWAAECLCARISGAFVDHGKVKRLRTPTLREFLLKRSPLRRVFPQKIFHMLLAEAEVDQWDCCDGRGQAALFHLGALSSMVTGIETPGWTSATDYKWQIINLFQYGAENGRVEEQPLMVQPEAVTISTIHGVKGLEFAGVFLADVNARRFPSSMAKRAADLPLDGPILAEIDAAGLSDNDNNDGERRLMYVALTRAERFLFVSHSGKQTSKFVRELGSIIRSSGGVVTTDSARLLDELRYAPKEHRRDIKLTTSFSDLRYYLECPHDFYFRKVLGFAPTIDQAFGYGRGVHNLMRAVHADPAKWAKLAGDRTALEAEVGRLLDRGLFYLRYTTGEPAENMRAKGARIVADYVERFAGELGSLTFEPEKSFETLVEYEDQDGGALISGAIDVIRRDDPPQVTLIDFKSGDPDSDKHQKLDEEQMRLQVALYAVAAQKELEYQPEEGLVRYLDAHDTYKAELKVPLDSDSLKEATKLVARTAASIRDRKFSGGPQNGDPENMRCRHCDFLGMCGMAHAIKSKKNGAEDW